MKMVKLSMIDGTRIEEGPGEDDQDLPTVTEITKPVVLDATQVRNFYPRKGDRVGTRILFRNGSALAVKEAFDEVEAAFRAALA